jgi:drug/metabolite transporter (DMT)-like permease
MTDVATEKSRGQEYANMMMSTVSFTICSMGMMVFNKLAIRSCPLACSLVALQMGFTALVMLTVFWKTLHIGSVTDALKWCRVVPFFVGMLLTSMFALKNAPMSLVITFRALTPLFTLGVEGMLPSPPRPGHKTMFSLIVMVAGASLYARDLGKPGEASASWRAVGWILLNTGLACTERVLQRLMLSKEQTPVDVSKTAASLLNNLVGMVPMIAIAFATGEHTQIHGVIAGMSHFDYLWVFLSCMVGVGISFTAIWAQSIISATSMLVLTNANKFVVILVELFLIPEAHQISRVQLLGAITAIMATVLYAKSREAEDAEAKALKALKEGAGVTERSLLIPKTV